MYVVQQTEVCGHKIRLSLTSRVFDDKDLFLGVFFGMQC